MAQDPAPVAQATPNNVLHGRGIVPGLKWNDAELLTRAGQALGANPPSGSSAQAAQIIKLFKHHDLAAPTQWATVQWVRRRDIPDRWRAVVVYMLLFDKKLAPAQLFRRAPKEAEAPA